MNNKRADVFKATICFLTDRKFELLLSVPLRMGNNETAHFPCSEAGWRDCQSGEVTGLSLESNFFLSFRKLMRGCYDMLRENPKDIILRITTVKT
jgi:hypothetical protein